MEIDNSLLIGIPEILVCRGFIISDKIGGAGHRIDKIFQNSK
jgi:hypothetical protein